MLTRFKNALGDSGRQGIPHRVGVEYAKHVQDTLFDEAYPPELPNQVYRRTYVLKESFFTQTIAPQTFLITNTATYSPYVIGRDDTPSEPSQADIHKGRWWTIQEIEERERGEVDDIAQKIVDEYFD